jgi:arsenical pump membrane protein
VIIAAIVAMVATLAIALAWRNAWAPAVGALVGVAIAAASGVATPDDITGALTDLWRPMIAIVAIMVTASSARELGVFAHLAGWIEPRTRGPARHGFRMVFALSAITAAVLSNDAAILMFTPIVIELLRQVYPKRHVKFVVPFSFAVFVAAGVAPLPTGNPMNLVVAERTGIALQEYAVRMVPVAIVGWVVAYAALAWCFKDELDDDAPALGRMRTVLPLSRAARIVLVVALGSILAYPIMAAVGAPLVTVAVPAAIACTVAAYSDGVSPRQVAAGVSWELLPFLFGVLVLATALSHVGLTDHLRTVYARTPAPLATVGTLGALGSALINNHPMALLHSIALSDAPHSLVLAALVGGDLGPRLLPIGSLAGLLWVHQLRQQAVVIPRRTFLRVGIIVTIPSLVASLITLWLVT